MNKRLLVADDAMIIREMIKDAARDAGWEIAGEAANGEEAALEFERLAPDAVTLDVVMPQYDGLHALRRIKQIDPNARVVMVSAVDQRSVLKQAFEYGVADFVVKPFDREALGRTLNALTA